MRRNQKIEVVKQIKQIDAASKRTGKLTKEQFDKRADLFNQYKRLLADIEAAEGKNDQFIAMISPELEGKPRHKP